MIARGRKGKGGYVKKAAKIATKSKAKKSPPAPKTRGVATKKKSPPPAPARKPPVRKSTKPRAVRVTRAAAKKMARQIADDIEEKAQRRAHAEAARVKSKERVEEEQEEAATTSPSKSTIRLSRHISNAEVEEMEREAMKNVKKRAKEMREEAERILAARGGSTAKIGWKDKKKKAEEESIPLDDAGLSWDRREELDNLCKMYRETVQTIKDQEEVKAALFVNIDEIAREVGLENVHTDVWRLVLARGKSRTISRESLLEAGVDMETIEGAMKESRWEKYQILAPESDEDESSESLEATKEAMGR